VDVSVLIPLFLQSKWQWCSWIGSSTVRAMRRSRVACSPFQKLAHANRKLASPTETSCPPTRLSNLRLPWKCRWHSAAWTKIRAFTRFFSVVRTPDSRHKLTQVLEVPKPVASLSPVQVVLNVSFSQCDENVRGSCALRMLENSKFSRKTAFDSLGAILSLPCRQQWWQGNLTSDDGLPFWGFH